MRTVRSSRKKFAIRSLWFTELCVLIVSVMAAARLRFHADPIGLEHFVEGIALRSLLVALCLTGAMLVGVRRGVLEALPWAELTLPREKAHEPIFLDTDQVRAIADACHGWGRPDARTR